MNLKNQPPVFVPQAHWREVERLSKAALMDIVWDYAMQIGGGGENEEAVQQATLKEFRARREIILEHRTQQVEAHREQTRATKAAARAVLAQDKRTT